MLLPPNTTRIVLTGGGSGGHTIPLIAVARELLRQQGSINLRYVGADGFSEHFMEEESIAVTTISSGKLRRYSSSQNITDIPRTIGGIFQALWHLYWYMPDVVFSKGGHGALPVVIAAIFYRIPIVVHESDSVPGMVNKWSGRFADRIGVAFDSALQYFSQKKTAVVGNPVRTNLIKNTDPPEVAKERFGFNAGQPVILVIGGSQGAEKINDFMLDLLPELIKKYQVIHQVGESNYEEVKSESELVIKDMGGEYGTRYKLFGFLSEPQYKDALRAADLVISRAGSGAIFEIALCGKPAILIPLGTSAADHQLKNAIEYSKSGACLYFEEANLLPHLFIDEVGQLLTDTARLAEMGKAAEGFSRPDSAHVIAEEIMRVAN